MASVTLVGVRKIYPGPGRQRVAVDGLDLAVSDGEFVVLVGPSGCGKSTTLRMMAGLESISAGTLSIGARVVNDVAPKDRNVAMVFQNYALYPHMTAYDNMAFNLKLRHVPAAEIDARVRD
ncbi:MAG TPA: ABC transporter ATP-binding protein, partial [Gemmatimonadales bacterium]